MVLVQSSKIGLPLAANCEGCERTKSLPVRLWIVDDLTMWVEVLEGDALVFVGIRGRQNLDIYIYIYIYNWCSIKYACFCVISLEGHMYLLICIVSALSNSRFICNWIAKCLVECFYVGNRSPKTYVKFCRFICNLSFLVVKRVVDSKKFD